MLPLDTETDLYIMNDSQEIILSSDQFIELHELESMLDDDDDSTSCSSSGRFNNCFYLY